MFLSCKNFELAKTYDFKKEEKRHTFRQKKEKRMLKEFCKIERLLPKKK